MTVENEKAKVELGAVERVFGKRLNELDSEERRLWRCAVKTASYYRRYERNKAQQRKDKSWVKLDILKVLGWPAACDECGYDKYVGALDFHHLDPHTKDGKVTTVEEARKCRLLCSNCHRETHWKERNNAEYRTGQRAAHSTGRPAKPLHPLVAAYLAAVGVSRPCDAVRFIGLGTDSVAGSVWTEAERLSRTCPRFLTGQGDCTCGDRAHWTAEHAGRLGDGTVCEEAGRYEFIDACGAQQAGINAQRDEPA